MNLQHHTHPRKMSLSDKKPSHPHPKPRTKYDTKPPDKYSHTDTDTPKSDTDQTALLTYYHETKLQFIETIFQNYYPPRTIVVIFSLGQKNPIDTISGPI